jgi:endonuclease/exonuclease/phosphatase (EEP) superfamily protein YafD
MSLMVAGLLLPQALHSPAAAAQVSKKVVQHNIHKDTAAMNQAVNKSGNVGAMGLTLQEVCNSQLVALKDAHGNWSFAAAQHNVGTTNCPGGETLWNVAIWRGGSSATIFTERLMADGKDGSIACVRFSESGQVFRLCSTHLWAGNGQDDGAGEAVRNNQAQRIKAITNPWIDAGQSVIVGGDFNTTPTKSPVNYMYASNVGNGGNGRFVDFNRNPNTPNNRNYKNTTDSGKQIDYVFFSTNRTPVSLAGTNFGVFGDESDHHICVATALVNT